MDDTQQERRYFHECLSKAQSTFEEGSYLSAVTMLKSLLKSTVDKRPQWYSPEEQGGLFNQLGLSLKRSGRFIDAIKAYENAVGTGGGTERRIYLNNLAVAHYEMGHFQLAYLFLDEAMFGLPQRSSTWVFYAVNRCTFDVATGLFKRARDLRKCYEFYRKHDPESDNMAHVCERCGVLLTAVGYPVEAIDVLQDALVSKELLCGSNHPRVGDACLALAEAHIVASQWAESLRFAERASSIYEVKVAPVAPYIGRCRMLQGHLADRLGRPGACERFDEAQRIFQESYDSGHGDLARLAVFRGEYVARHLGDYRSAIAQFTRACDTQPSVSCVCRAESHNNLAYCLMKLGRFRASGRHLIQSHRLFRQFSRRHHPYLVDLYRNYRDLLLKTNHSRLAEVLEMRLGNLAISRLAPHSVVEPIQEPKQLDGFRIVLFGKEAALCGVAAKLRTVKEYYAKEGFELDWFSCANLKGLVQQLASNSPYQGMSVTLYEQGLEPARVTQELADRWPMVTDYRHMSWIEVGIAILLRECDVNYVYCAQAGTVADSFKREVNATPTSTCFFKCVNLKKSPDAAWLDCNRSIVTAFEAFVQSNSFKGERHGNAITSERETRE